MIINFTAFAKGSGGGEEKIGMTRCAYCLFLFIKVLLIIAEFALKIMCVYVCF